MSKQVTYLNPDGSTAELVILKEHADKTVDIGTAGGDAVVTFAELSDAPEVGKATLAKVQKK